MDSISLRSALVDSAQQARKGFPLLLSDRARYFVANLSGRVEVLGDKALSEIIFSTLERHGPYQLPEHEHRDLYAFEHAAASHRPAAPPDSATLIEACQQIDSDFEKHGEVNPRSIDMLRDALRKMGVVPA